MNHGCKCVVRKKNSWGSKKIAWLMIMQSQTTRQTGRQRADKEGVRQADRQTDRKREREGDRQTDRKREREGDRQTDRWFSRPTDRKTETETSKLILLTCILYDTYRIHFNNSALRDIPSRICDYLTRQFVIIVLRRWRRPKTKLSMAQR